MGRFRSIAHPFAARQHVLLRLLPLDLHVLGTPPAFNLSQDQTLHLKIAIFSKGVSIGPIAGLFGTRLMPPKDASTRVPTQITCKFLDSTTAAWAAEGGGIIGVNRIPSTIVFRHLSATARTAGAIGA